MRITTRMRLSMLGVLFIGAGFGYAHLASRRYWVPELPGFILAVAGALHIALAIKPASEFSYRVGGTLAFGALLARIATVVLGLPDALEVDAYWAVFVSVDMTLILAIVYGHWWLGSVHRWHNRRRADG